MKVIFDPDIPKPLNQWSNKDFLIYFSNHLYLLDHKGLTIPPNGWVVYISMIKGFRQKLSISNSKYKQFIDWLMTDIFTQENYTPNFGCVISEMLFNMFSKMLGRKREEFTNEDFAKIKNEVNSRLKQFPWRK
jgi:hypothetical protein